MAMGPRIRTPRTTPTRNITQGIKFEPSRPVRLSASHSSAVPRAGAACRPSDDAAPDVLRAWHAADDFLEGNPSQNDGTATDPGPTGDAGRKSAAPDDPEPSDAGCPCEFIALCRWESIPESERRVREQSL